jgi:hypothetical protein
VGVFLGIARTGRAYCYTLIKESDVNGLVGRTRILVIQIDSCIV